MEYLNSVLIEGYLVKDAFFRVTSEGVNECTFTLVYRPGEVEDSVDFSGPDEAGEGVDYFDVKAVSELAESCGRQGCKGRVLRVVGRLKQDRWRDADGRHRSRVFIMADHVQFWPEGCVVAVDDELHEFESDAWGGVPQE
jgi:single-strand DNA-binding protein